MRSFIFLIKLLCMYMYVSLYFNGKFVKIYEWLGNCYGDRMNKKLWSIGGSTVHRFYWYLIFRVELKLPAGITVSKVPSQAVCSSEKSPLRSDNDSPLYAECVQSASTGKPAISYVLLRPGSDCNTTTVTSVPDAAVCGGSPAYSDRGPAVRRRSSVSEQGDLRALSDRMEQLGAVDVARSLATSASADAVAWTLVTHRGCCISLPHSGISSH